MAVARDACGSIQHSPARKESRSRRFREWLERAPTPVKIVANVYERDDQGGDNWDAEDGVGESAMMGEADSAAFEVPKHVDVWSFGGEGHSNGSECGLASEAGAAQGGAVEEVGDGFQ
jgi:hypothetical protein